MDSLVLALHPTTIRADDVFWFGSGSGYVDTALFARPAFSLA